MKTSYPLKKIKVVLFEGIHERAANLFRDAGFQVETYAGAFKGQELIDIAADAHIIGLRSKTHLQADFFAACKHLWAVGCFCIGTNQVDLDAAAAHGVRGTHHSKTHGPSLSLSSPRLLLCMATVRCLWACTQAADEIGWRARDRGRTLGTGYGRIGSQVSVLAEYGHEGSVF